jgi:hypothetical protein
LKEKKDIRKTDIKKKKKKKISERQIARKKKRKKEWPFGLNVSSQSTARKSDQSEVTISVD